MPAAQQQQQQQPADGNNAPAQQQAPPVAPAITQLRQAVIACLPTSHNRNLTRNQVIRVLLCFPQNPPVHVIFRIMKSTAGTYDGFHTATKDAATRKFFADVSEDEAIRTRIYKSLKALQTENTNAALQRRAEALLGEVTAARGGQQPANTGVGNANNAGGQQPANTGAGATPTDRGPNPAAAVDRLQYLDSSFLIRGGLEVFYQLCDSLDEDGDHIHYHTEANGQKRSYRELLNRYLNANPNKLVHSDEEKMVAIRTSIKNDYPDFYGIFEDCLLEAHTHQKETARSKVSKITVITRFPEFADFATSTQNYTVSELLTEQNRADWAYYICSMKTLDPVFRYYERNSNNSTTNDSEAVIKETRDLATFKKTTTDFNRCFAGSYSFGVLIGADAEKMMNITCDCATLTSERRKTIAQRLVATFNMDQTLAGKYASVLNGLLVAVELSTLRTNTPFADVMQQFRPKSLGRKKALDFVQDHSPGLKLLFRWILGTPFSIDALKANKISGGFNGISNNIEARIAAAWDTFCREWVKSASFSNGVLLQSEFIHEKAEALDRLLKNENLPDVSSATTKACKDEIKTRETIFSWGLKFGDVNCGTVGLDEAITHQVSVHYLHNVIVPSLPLPQAEIAASFSKNNNAGSSSNTQQHQHHDSSNQSNHKSGGRGGAGKGNRGREEETQQPTSTPPPNTAGDNVTVRGWDKKSKPMKPGDHDCDYHVGLKVNHVTADCESLKAADGQQPTHIVYIYEPTVNRFVPDVEPTNRKREEAGLDKFPSQSKLNALVRKEMSARYGK